MHALLETMLDCFYDALPTSLLLHACDEQQSVLTKDRLGLGKCSASGHQRQHKSLQVVPESGNFGSDGCTLLGGSFLLGQKGPACLLYLALHCSLSKQFHS